MTAKPDHEIKVLKLRETHADAHGMPNDALAMFRIWTLLTGGDEIRDLTVGNRALQ